MLKPVFVVSAKNPFDNNLVPTPVVSVLTACGNKSLDVPSLFNLTLSCIDHQSVAVDFAITNSGAKPV